MINPTLQANDYAAINQGQLKNIAKQALAEMDAHLPVDSQDGLHLLVTGWNQPGAATNDYVAVNLGQVKTVAKFFYVRFQAGHYTDRFPWTGSPAPANDFAPANIGQVKNLFSFDFTKDGAGLDLDHNGLPDRWEITNFGHTGVDPYADPDDDGLTNRQEYVLGTDPNDYTNNGSRAVLLTSPISGKTYPASADVHASAATVMPGSVVTKVEFHADGAKIGESPAEPYGVTWSHPPIGSHSLVAVATDDQGLTVSSRSATIQVAAAPRRSAWPVRNQHTRKLPGNSSQG